jgi:hypothetical protein
VSLELESWEVKVGCPITSRAACPVVKSAAHNAAAENKNIEMHFMGKFLGPESLDIEFSITERLFASAYDDWRHSGVYNWYPRRVWLREQQALWRFMPVQRATWMPSGS